MRKSTRGWRRRVQGEGEGKVEAQPRAAAGRAMPAAARRQERAAAMSRLPLRAAAALPGYGRGAAPPQVPGRVRGRAGSAAAWAGRREVQEVRERIPQRRPGCGSGRRAL